MYVCVHVCVSKSLWEHVPNTDSLSQDYYSLYTWQSDANTNRMAAKSKSTNNTIIIRLIQGLPSPSLILSPEQAWENGNFYLIQAWSTKTTENMLPIKTPPPKFWEVFWNSNKVCGVNFALWLPHWDNRGLSVGVLPDPRCVGQTPVWSKLPAVLTAASVVPFVRNSIRSSLHILFNSKPLNYKSSKMPCILPLPSANFKSRIP